MKIKIEVTEEDIKNGIRRNALCCPIAIASKRILNCDVLVQPSAIVNGDNYWIHGSLPQIARQFINDFDNNFKVEPFWFEMYWVEST